MQLAAAPKFALTVRSTGVTHLCRLTPVPDVFWSPFTLRNTMRLRSGLGTARKNGNVSKCSANKSKREELLRLTASINKGPLIESMVGAVVAGI